MAERFLTFGSVASSTRCRRAVAEIIRLPAVARVPQAPRGLLGLADLRGNVLPVASLQGLLGGAATTETRRAIVSTARRRWRGVDVVEALVIVDAEQIETRQAELAARPARSQGAFATDGKKSVVKILDIAALISAAFVQDDRARPRRTRSDLDVRAATTTDGTDDRQMLVSFDVAGQEYAFALDVVLEVLNAPENLAALPVSEDLVLGVAPFRDTLLPLLSLRGLPGFAARRA
jgi:purine-binding chemotaxis protein CheW